MSELKTLKDLEIIDHSCPDKKEGCCVYHCRHTGLIKLEELRAEAIKDYKDDVELYPHIFYTLNQKEAVRRYIKWKFNLTEEDLKEKNE